MSSWLPAGLLLLASTAALFPTQFAPTEGEPVAVMFPPGTTAKDALLHASAAGGSVVKHGAWDGVVIARSDAPDFVAALYARGAWLVVSAKGARGCVSPEI